MRKTESLKATHLPALPFCSNSCLFDFIPSRLPFHMVYNYWQNLPASVEVSLHLSSFLPHYFALWFLFPLLDFVIILCDSNYLVWLWFLNILLWCLLPLSTSISWLYNMDWVIESKQIVFLVFQFFAVVSIMLLYMIVYSSRITYNFPSFLHLVDFGVCIYSLLVWI